MVVLYCGGITHEQILVGMILSGIIILLGGVYGVFICTKDFLRLRSFALLG